eukprot:TRINITY_DN28055_c2_g3_i2.p1 TRINITY_DN28055_c2_g3~~TRINITY_DN28055_c2_g3_i2.p1  ORF type:complete len:388 (+),score=119.35 TRINITY_DN28055_c2_g3_i2:91-1164(+)
MAEQALPPGWAEFFDDAAGCKYYYNEATGETQWSPPVVAKGPPRPPQSPPPPHVLAAARAAQAAAAGGHQPYSQSEAPQPAAEAGQTWEQPQAEQQWGGTQWDPQQGAGPLTVVTGAGPVTAPSAGDACDMIHYGRVKNVGNSAQGHAFINCPELHQLYGRDVYLHRNQISAAGGVEPGTLLRFTIALNAQGHPQARNASRCFMGHVKKELTGDFTFISCPELSAQFGRDVYLHRVQAAEAAPGCPLERHQEVYFLYNLSKQGHPQARHVSVKNMPGSAARAGQFVQPSLSIPRPGQGAQQPQQCAGAPAAPQQEQQQQEQQAAPKPVGTPPGWERFQDDSGAWYIHNAATGESRWE